MRWRGASRFVGSRGSNHATRARPPHRLQFDRAIVPPRSPLLQNGPRNRWYQPDSTGIANSVRARQVTTVYPIVYILPTPKSGFAKQHCASQWQVSKVWHKFVVFWKQHCCNLLTSFCHPMFHISPRSISPQLFLSRFYFCWHFFILFTLLFEFFGVGFDCWCCVFSRQFGFLKLNSPEQTKKKALVVRAIKYLERMLEQAQAEKQRRKADSTKNDEELKTDDEEDKGISIDPKTYCKLGHFHLLLEDFSKGLKHSNKIIKINNLFHLSIFICLHFQKFWSEAWKQQNPYILYLVLFTCAFFELQLCQRTKSFLP